MKVKPLAGSVSELGSHDFLVSKRAVLLNEPLLVILPLSQDNTFSHYFITGHCLDSERLCRNHLPLVNLGPLKYVVQEFSSREYSIP